MITTNHNKLEWFLKLTFRLKNVLTFYAETHYVIKSLYNIMTSPNVTGYVLNSTASAWPQHVKFTLPEHLSRHLDFPSVRVAWSVTFILGFVMIMD